MPKSLINRVIYLLHLAEDCMLCLDQSTEARRKGSRTEALVAKVSTSEKPLGFLIPECVNQQNNERNCKPYTTNVRVIKVSMPGEW